MDKKLKSFLKTWEGTIVAENNGRFTMECPQGYALGIASYGDDVELYWGEEYGTCGNEDDMDDYCFFKRSGEFIAYLRPMLSNRVNHGWSDDMLKTVGETIAKLE
jgi:hypothetical protein